MIKVTKEEVFERLGEFTGEVENMITSRGGKAVNQFIMYYGNGKVFKSYNSIIAVIIYDQVTVIGSYYDYSNTTNKYRCAFLGENIKETRKNLKDETYLFCEEF